MPSLEQEKDLYEKTGLQGGMVSAQNWGGGGGDPREPPSFAQKRLQIPPTQN